MDDLKRKIATAIQAIAKQKGIQHVLLLEQRYYGRRVDELAKRWEERKRTAHSLANLCEVEERVAALKDSKEELSAAMGNMAFIWAVVEYNTAPVEGVSYSARVKAFPLECAQYAQRQVQQIAKVTQEASYNLLNGLEDILA